ncbi:zinc-binding dehydrogenase [Mycobacterium sp. DL440]|uniref:zinc-binding dehydrogenase n=1 Tax=Mycobacterium sp. DL440 TaxID=2675523 RepID=UPI001FB8EDA5|nr:zinc-binding dehydrogenase [Mycobacterium sp. DL440]
MIGTGRPTHRRAALDLGVDVFVDLEGGWVEAVGQVDVVFDVLGGEILDCSTQLVRAGGTLVTIAEPPRVQPADARAAFFVVEPDRAKLAVLERRLRKGKLRSIVGAVLPLSDAVSAFNPAKRVAGKTIIRVVEGS